MKLGFIGTGNMASAIMGGVINKNIIPGRGDYRRRPYLHQDERE